MLRITIQNEAEAIVFRLEGRLSGSWVQELADCWASRVAAEPGKPSVRVDLTEVTYVDAAGKAFLATKRAEGAELIARGCMMRALVSEISNKSDPECELPSPRCTNQARGVNT